MTVSGSREDLVDEVYMLRSFLAREKREHEQTRRELALALDRLEDLEAKLEAIEEQQEEPHV